MVKISEQLIRKKSEHNELLITTLEELSLHQENIEKIELLQDWCRDLKILLLQSNLISKIENLNKLKKLEYLNLAINNIEEIENLEGLESLQKLDLTLNFIGKLTSVECLKNNFNLEELFLTGNPCTDYEGYREFVISVLPQLKVLDGSEITRTERLLAIKSLEQNRKKIVQLQMQYQISRDEQKVRVQDELKQMEAVDLDDEQKLKEFWNMKSEHCPEIRTEIAKKSKKSNDTDVNIEKKKEPKFQPKLFAPCGRPYNLNLGKLKFHLEDDPEQYHLELEVYKYLDTSLIDVDVQPNYVRVSVKGKVFQLALNDEVSIEKSSCQRSQTTGFLSIVMPKLNAKDHVIKKVDQKISKKEPEKLKFGEAVDIKTIVKDSFDFDESEVPPLI